MKALRLSPEEGFVLSRLDTPLSVRELVALTGLEEGRVVEIVGGLEAQGAIDVDHDAPALPPAGSRPEPDDEPDGEPDGEPESEQEPDGEPEESEQEPEESEQEPEESEQEPAEDPEEASRQAAGSREYQRIYETVFRSMSRDERASAALIAKATNSSPSVSTPNRRSSTRCSRTPSRAWSTLA